MVMDAPLPGIGGWEAGLSDPKVWHFNFHGPDEERLVARADLSRPATIILNSRASLLAELRLRHNL